MNLYLVQHADAKSDEEDPRRPLSDKGRMDIFKTASFAKSGLKVDEIFHSGKLRASQTAEVLAELINPLKGTKAEDGLNPNDDPKIWAKRLKGLGNDFMIVGHLPHLQKLASILLCGDPDKEIIKFQRACILCLGYKDNVWTVRWMIMPEVLK